MSDRRLSTLLDKELDGSLSVLERTELDRRSLLSPSTRRERATWTRILAALPRPQPRLRVEAMAAAICSEVLAREADSLLAGWLPRPPRRRTFALAALAACLALFAVTTPSSHTRRGEVAQLTNGPVELELALDAHDDDDGPVVTIHF